MPAQLSQPCQMAVTAMAEAHGVEGCRLSDPAHHVPAQRPGGDGLRPPPWRRLARRGHGATAHEAELAAAFGGALVDDRAQILWIPWPMSPVDDHLGDRRLPVRRLPPRLVIDRRRQAIDGTGQDAGTGGGDRALGVGEGRAPGIPRQNEKNNRRARFHARGKV